MSTGSTSRRPRGRHAQQQATFLLEDLPSEALQLITNYASRPSEPAACLLPIVCRSWQSAVEKAQPLVDISVDMAARWFRNEVDSDTLDLAARTRRTRASVAANAEAPLHLVRGRLLAAWVVKRSSSVRSLHIPQHPKGSTPRCGWASDLSLIVSALTMRARVAGLGVGLLHLTRLDLPVMGLPGSLGLMEALAGCPSLQHLTLKKRVCPRHIAGLGVVEPVTFDQAALALAPLKHLRALHLEWPDRTILDKERLPGLLQQLPATLESLHFQGAGCGAVIPLSCVTHLANLREWADCNVRKVLDSSSADATTTTTTSSSGSGGSGGACVKAPVLTALVGLHSVLGLEADDARLHLTSLQSLELHAGACPEAWQVLQAMPHLTQLALEGDLADYQAVDMEGVGKLTGLRDLSLGFISFSCMDFRVCAALAASLSSLASLGTLRLEAAVLLVNGPTLLAGATRLRQLTITFRHIVAGSAYPQDVHYSGCMGKDVLWVVGNALCKGQGQLQRVVLEDRFPTWAPWVNNVAPAAMPGVELVRECNQ